MVERMAQDADHIILACGATDFRRQIAGLLVMVQQKFALDPYSPSHLFLFCNRQRNAIKALRYDKNGFVLLTKKLMGDQKFQWPRTSAESKEITRQQIRWLTEGLEIEPKRAHKSIVLAEESTCY